MRNGRLLPLILLLASLLNVAAKNPLMGWSSWNTYRVNINDSLIMRQALEIKRLGLDSLGYRYVNIDDGFFGGRGDDGKLLIHPGRFPDGLKGLVDRIHAMGLKAGIYSDAGANTCGNFWDNDTIARGVGLYGHEKDDCELFFDSIGFDFIKVDFCGGDAFQNADHLSLEPEERYRAIREAMGDSVIMNICRWNYPGNWVREVGDSWRVTQDISCHWESVRNIISQNLYLSAYADGKGFNDMDMLEIGRGLSEEEDRTHFGIWCLMSSPLLIGCDIASLPAAALDLVSNKELIAINQDPLSLQAYVASRQGGGYVLAKDIKQRHGNERAVALYNPTDSSLALTLRFADIDLGGSVALRDIMNRKEAGTHADSLSLTVPPHGVRIFTAKADKRHERALHEAETAYLGGYQEIYNPIYAGTAFYEADSTCSGGMRAANLGGRPGNDLVWQHVHLQSGGPRQITLRLVSPEERQMFVSVNGGAGELVTVPPGTSDITLTKTFAKGDNRVRLYNDRAPMPDIDCLIVGKAAPRDTPAAH